MLGVNIYDVISMQQGLISLWTNKNNISTDIADRTAALAVWWVDGIKYMWLMLMQFGDTMWQPGLGIRWQYKNIISISGACIACRLIVCIVFNIYFLYT